MDISRDALLQVIRATKITRIMMESLNELLSNSTGSTLADEAYGLLCDALSAMNGETFTAKQDFLKDSQVVNLLNNRCATPDDIANEIIMNHNRNTDGRPGPHTIEPDEMKDMVRKVGGYQFQTPEGEWSKKSKRLKSELKDCRNELCEKCGDYREAHLGRCDGCRWKDEWREALYDAE